jgi:hypothetical protein
LLASWRDGRYVTLDILARKLTEGRNVQERIKQMKMKLGRRAKTVSTFFIGKWTVKIVSLLYEKPHRHGKLRRRLGSVSQRMLTRTLRNLESIYRRCATPPDE